MRPAACLNWTRCPRTGLLDVPCATAQGIFAGAMLITNRRLGTGPEGRWVGIQMSGLCLLLMAALAGGCAHKPKPGHQGGAVEDSSAPRIPAFLNGPVVLLLTNAHGFRAHAVLESGAPPQQVELTEGELMSQGGKLMFAPAPGSSGGKRSPLRGCGFIWDVTTGRGFLLNDPMQAYAPILASRQFTNLLTGSVPNGSAPEKISGHPCQPAQATVTASDGSLTGYRLWRATDLNGFPVRITRASAGPAFTLTLSKIRLATLPDDVFQPPRGFVKHDNADALMNELAARQQSLKRRPVYKTEGSEPDSAPDSSPPARP